MPPRYNAFQEQGPTALLDGAQPFDPMPTAPENDAPEDASPIHLVGNPGAGPSMPSPKGVRPDVPRGPQAVPGTPAPGKPQAPAPQQGGYQGIDDNYVQAYKEVLRQKFPGMDEKKLNQYADYGIAKQRGKIAAQNKKLLAKPLGRYFSALQQEANAKTNVEAVMEGMKSKQAEFLNPDGTMSPQWMPYQDKIDAAVHRAKQATEARKRTQEFLGQHGVKPEYLESPVTVMEFMRQLAAGDPGTAGEVGDDDPLEVFGDQQTDGFDPTAGVLR
ncbi:MAG: hypothetical protein KA788_06660 [Lacunisphaera sp.]|nr:hypothetical protein [Lacunisphaera sp.]